MLQMKAMLQYIERIPKCLGLCFLTAATQSSLKLKVPGFSVKTRQTVRASPRLKPKVLQEVCMSL